MLSGNFVVHLVVSGYSRTNRVYIVLSTRVINTFVEWTWNKPKRNVTEICFLKALKMLLICSRLEAKSEGKFAGKNKD
jgi:hypothetical protein